MRGAATMIRVPPILDRLEALVPRTLAIHRGATFAGDVRQALKDFRTELSHRAW